MVCSHVTMTDASLKHGPPQNCVRKWRFQNPISDRYTAPPGLVKIIAQRTMGNSARVGNGILFGGWSWEEVGGVGANRHMAVYWKECLTAVQLVTPFWMVKGEVKRKLTGDPSYGKYT